MEELTDSHERRRGAPALRERLDADSYLYFRGLLGRERVREVRGAILAVLEDDGWLADDGAGSGRVSAVAEPEGAPPSDHYLATYADIQALQVLHELALDPALIGVTELVIGGPVFTFPMKIVRLGVPTPQRWTTPAHQDYPLIRGTPDVITTWIPLGDFAPELGGLKILRGSHHVGLRTIVPGYGVGGVGVEADDDDERWATATFAMGDVLAFHSMTVHAAIANRSDEIRLSADFRYQSVDAPVSESVLRPHYFPSVPAYDELTRNWTSRRAIETPPGLVVVSPETEVDASTSRVVSFD